MPADRAWDLGRALRLARTDAARVELVREGVGLIDVEVVAAGSPVRLRLRRLDRTFDGAAWFLLGALMVEPLPPLVAPGALAEAVRRLAALPLAAPDEWPAPAAADAACAAAGATLWQIFGARLWPGAELTEGWLTRTTRIRPDGALLALEGLGGALCDVAVTIGAASTGDPAAPVTPVLRSASLTLGLAGVVAPAAAPLDLVRGLVELVRRSGDTPVALAPAVAAALEPGPRPGAGRPPAGAAAPTRPSAPRLVVTVRHPGSRAPELVFFVTAARAGVRHYRSEGAVAVSYVAAAPGRAAPRTPRFTACVDALLDAARRVGAPPDAGTAARWRAAIEVAAKVRPITAACDWTIEER